MTFECICLAAIPQSLNDGKLGPTSTKCAMLGYGPDCKACRIFDPGLKTAVVPSEVCFDEYTMYYQEHEKNLTKWENVAHAIVYGGI